MEPDPLNLYTFKPLTTETVGEPVVLTAVLPVRMITIPEPPAPPVVDCQ